VPHVAERDCRSTSSRRGVSVFMAELQASMSLSFNQMLILNP
jgi:hypothetical protein